MIVGDPQVELAVKLSRLERECLAKRLGRRKCCQCNGNGSCIRCECATSLRPCSNCLPLKRHRCANSAVDTLDPSQSGSSSSPAPRPTNAGDISGVSLNREPRPACASKQEHRGHSASQASSKPACSVPIGVNLFAGSQDNDFVQAPTTTTDGARSSASDGALSQVDHVEASLVGGRHRSLPDSNLNSTAIFDQVPVVASAVFGERDDSTSRCTHADLALSSALPLFNQLSSTLFKWGDVPGDDFCAAITSVYEEQVKWRKNLFSPPSGHAGTDYVKEHTRLLRAYRDGTPLERVALRAIMVMPGLLLQRPHVQAGAKEFSQHLARRLDLWKAGRSRSCLIVSFGAGWPVMFGIRCYAISFSMDSMAFSATLAPTRIAYVHRLIKPWVNAA